MSSPRSRVIPGHFIARDESSIEKHRNADSCLVMMTERLVIRRPRKKSHDASVIFRLWTDSRVMSQVGFPEGLPVTRRSIDTILVKNSDAGCADRILMIDRRSDGTTLGHCKLGLPDQLGTSTTDIKLLPAFWGNGYGTETKRALVTWLFSKTNCQAVKATPNVKNIASQRMQFAAGAMLTGAGIYRFPAEQYSFTIPVCYFIYMISRASWAQSPLCGACILCRNG